MRSKGYFIFGGESSEDFGLYTAGSGTYNSPERDVERVKIPGRNGLLIRDNGSFNNVQVVFTILLKDNFTETVFDVKSWLMSKTGYARLEDSFNPNYYRMASFSGSIDWTIGQLLRYGYCDITFDCLPQLYLKSGETTIDIDADGTEVVNPTRFTAKPLISVVCSGSGNVYIGDQTVVINDLDGQLKIDSELMDCYFGAYNRNEFVSVHDGFPELKSGTTNISFDGDIESVELVGRWWTI